MSPHSDFVPPPRVAAWLVTLFTPAVEAESILGDLHEEYCSIASKSNVALARRWYWRQAVKTVLHFIIAAFRDAPLLMLASVLGGILSIGFVSRFSQHAMQEYLDAHRVYELHPDAYLFWLKLPLETGRVLLCGLLGLLIALAVKGKELPATVSFGLAQILLFLMAVFAVIASGRAWSDWLVFMLPWNWLCFMATIVGGVIVRTRRSSRSTKPSAS